MGILFLKFNNLVTKQFWLFDNKTLLFLTQSIMFLCNTFHLYDYETRMKPFTTVPLLMNMHLTYNFHLNRISREYMKWLMYCAAEGNLSFFFFFIEKKYLLIRLYILVMTINFRNQIFWPESSLSISIIILALFMFYMLSFSKKTSYYLHILVLGYLRS